MHAAATLQILAQILSFLNEAKSMNSEPCSISIKERARVEAKPDVALLKFHVAGEGVSMTDAVESVERRVIELGEYLKNAYKEIRQVDVFDAYFGQKQDRLGAEPQPYPRPLVVRGLLVTTSPDDSSMLHHIIDDGVKKGALLTNPQRHPAIIHSALESALLFGLVASEEHERRAVEECLKGAATRGRNIAAAAGRQLGELIRIADATVEPSVGEPFPKEFAHVRRAFPTQFLSVTAHKVMVFASLTATYEILK
jgi:uncharacterized protein YggE